MAPRKTAAKKSGKAPKATTKKTAKTPPKTTTRAPRKSTADVPAGESYVTYTPEISAAVCALISEGASVRAIAAMQGMPSKAAIFQWLAKHEDFRVAYMAATHERAHARYESMDEVMDDLRRGKIDSRAARVMVDALKWQCAIEAPERYGQVSRHELTGRNGGPIKSQQLPAADMTPEERQAEIRNLAAQHPELFATVASGPAH
ncbi:MAG: hypothetical protein GAK28_00618 [Luteibacter sp.]|uniref:terminase small subunit-like protein n=1 Tax=Luteibacter sp. TaxID=1886636 RepID=UPI001380A9F5|nr:hypothetical protein [Luteibacter sp.]KAF1008986.1 MAG: hypothetical protein GAK28_00618 [Luteibacter sp.]